jgi:hypothetical protein
LDALYTRMRAANGGAIHPGPPLNALMIITESKRCDCAIGGTEGINFSLHEAIKQGRCQCGAVSIYHNSRGEMDKASAEEKQHRDSPDWVCLEKED